MWLLERESTICFQTVTEIFYMESDSQLFVVLNKLLVSLQSMNLLLGYTLPGKRFVLLGP